MLLSGITFNDRPLAELEDEDFDALDQGAAAEAFADWMQGDLIERREYGLPIPAQNAVEAVLWADIDRARARAAVDFVAPGRYSTEQVIL
jgi:hypothetical protein